MYHSVPYRGSLSSLSPRSRLRGASEAKAVEAFRSHCFSFIFLQTSVVCPVFEWMTVVSGRQLQVTVLAFSCLTTTQCSMSSAVGGGAWLRIEGGAFATGCFFVAQPARSRQDTSQAFLMPFVSLSRARLSMAILVTRPGRGHPAKAGSLLAAENLRSCQGRLKS